MDLSNCSELEIIELYSSVIKELKNRKIIRTKNVLGDLGEYLAIKYYCNNTKLPNLQAAPINTQNIDAIDRNGERYSIKSTSGTQTGVFYGLNEKGSNIPDDRKFEYVIICCFNDNLELNAIYQLDWKTFIKHKKWHSRMKAWDLSVTQKLISDCKVIYKKETVLI
ncbi:MAG: hypothetical protein ACLSWI_02685 [Candidatus Gastranaerophilaceae bacterium]